jgi:hypothetical protein
MARRQYDAPTRFAATNERSTTSMTVRTRMIARNPLRTSGFLIVVSTDTRNAWMRRAQKKILPFDRL